MEEWILFQQRGEWTMANSLYIEMEQDVLYTYKQIISSRYVTNRSLELITNDAKKRISVRAATSAWRPLLGYIDGVFRLSFEKKSYHEFERRFLYLFEALNDDLLEVEPYDDQAFLKALIRLTIEYAHVEESPWPEVLFQHTKKMEIAQIEYIYDELTAIDQKACSRSLAVIYSYISIVVGKEMTALTLLTNQTSTFTEQELHPHFALLKKRSRWRTLDQWFKKLFPKRNHGQFGSLQPIWDELQTAYSSNTDQQESIWNRWLLSPNDQRFLQLCRHLKKDQELELIEQLLPELEKRLHQLEAAKTYERWLLRYKKFELAKEYFLKHELEPLRMRNEKVELLDAISKEQPLLARPIFHQMVVRLVEKKSRVHYQQAASYIKNLQLLYEGPEEEERFKYFLTKLKKQYRTYRAFVEELKQIDL